MTAALDQPCFRCGRPTDGTREVHLAVSGALVPVDAAVPASEDQGWFPIGPECAKKLSAGLVRSTN